MTKAQGRRSQKNKGRYKDRFNITLRNKARRAARRAKIAQSPGAIRRKEARAAKEAARKAALKKGQQ